MPAALRKIVSELLHPQSRLWTMMPTSGHKEVRGSSRAIDFYQSVQKQFQKKKQMTSFKNRVVRDMSDEVYHLQLPLDKHSFSSSQVKTAAKNPFKFHKEVVKGEKAEYSPVTLDAFTVVHYFHAAFLEPDTV